MYHVVIFSVKGHNHGICYIRIILLNKKTKRDFIEVFNVHEKSAVLYYMN